MPSARTPLLGYAYSRTPVNVIILIRAHLSTNGTRVLAVFTIDNEQIFTGLHVRLGKKASLSLANVAWYVLQVV